MFFQTHLDLFFFTGATQKQDLKFVFLQSCFACLILSLMFFGCIFAISSPFFQNPVSSLDAFATSTPKQDFQHLASTTVEQPLWIKEKWHWHHHDDSFSMASRRWITTICSCTALYCGWVSQQMTSFATFKTYLFDCICDNGGDTVKVSCSSYENTVVRLLINENVLVSF